MFNYGTQYYRYPNPDSRFWEEDFSMMHCCGFNTVKLWANWSNIHTAPDQFDFEPLVELINLAERYELQVVVNTILENAPYWLIHRLPEARYKTSIGYEIYPQARGNTPGGGWPGLCPDHPEVRAEMERFLRECVRNLTGPNLYAFDIWNETHHEAHQYFDPRMETGLICFCHHSNEKFISWLKKKYGTITCLNRAWRRSYGAWEEVYPPRQYGSYPDLLDWQRFRVEIMTEQLAWRYQACRSVDPTIRLISHIGVMHTPAKYQNDSSAMAAVVDEWGVSTFSAYDTEGNITDEMLFRLDYIRSDSNGKKFWQAELKGGQNTGGNGHHALRRSALVDPRTINGWNWIVLMAGAKGLFYWQYRPEMFGPESIANGLTDLEGKPTIRLETASKFARLLIDNPFLEDCVPYHADIAILNIQEAEMMGFLLDDHTNWFNQALEGIHKALSALNFSVDIVRADRLSEYQVVYIPFAQLVDHEHVEAIKQFIATGGVVISETCLAHYEENAFCESIIPGQGFHKVFAVKQKETIWAAMEDRQRMFRGIQVDAQTLAKGGVYESALQPEGAKVLFLYGDGTPAVTCNRWRSGTAVYIGTYPSISAYADDQAAISFYRELFKRLGISPMVATSSPTVQARLHHYGDETLLFVVNRQIAPAKVTVTLPAGFGNANVSPLLNSPKVTILTDGLHLSLEGCDGALYLLS